MKPTKKKSINQLEKFSAVFMQLGLVATLFIVFIALEHQTSKEGTISSTDFVIDEYKYPKFDNVPVFIKEENLKKKPIKPKVVTRCFEDMQKVENKDIETVVDIDPIEDQNDNFINNLSTIYEPEDSVDNEVPFIVIEEAPIFKGCENLTEEENKTCFTRQMSKFVQRNFNSDLAQDLGLREGKHKIYAQFLIDKTGSIKEIQIRAPHKSLEKEVNRIIKKIPQFIPGKQRGKPVKVKYVLPIAFQVN